MCNLEVPPQQLLAHTEHSVPKLLKLFLAERVSLCKNLASALMNASRAIGVIDCGVVLIMRQAVVRHGGISVLETVVQTLDVVPARHHE